MVEEAMGRSGFPDIETTIVAGMLALRQSGPRTDPWWTQSDGGRRRFDELLAEADADIAAGRVVSGEVAMQRARDLVERKRRNSTAPE